MLLLITYDLSQPQQNYPNLYDAIKGCSTKWWHYLDSTWIITTSYSIEDCANKIHAVMDNDDSLFIVEITDANYKGWLPTKAWEWLRENRRG